MLMMGTLQGCFTTHLHSFEPPQQLEQLAESAARHLPIQITNDFVDESRGFQFLLGLFPVARVFPESLSHMVLAKMVAHAGFNNLGLIETAPTEADSNAGPGPRVHVTVGSVSINGYDLLLTRRPSASVTLQASLYLHTGLVRACHGSGSFAEFTRYAFERDLENALEQAVDAASREAVECLLQGISTAALYPGDQL